MRVVFDTNILISGTLWSGTPALILQAAYANRFETVSSESLLDEFKDVLERPKFASRLALTEQTSIQIVEQYATLAHVIQPKAVERVISADEDDDQVLACALEGDADYIVSGDPHLLDLGEYKHIPIPSASKFLALLAET